jgi:hypothetical protein
MENSSDWESFLAVRFEETFTSFSRNVNLEGKSLVVVVQGELLVTLNPTNSRDSHTARILRPGDVMFLFSVGLDVNQIKLLNNAQIDCGHFKI